MKPREFWIDTMDPNLKKDNYAGPQYVWNFKTSESAIHVREVVPIDWVRVWHEFEADSLLNDLAEFQMNLIQELVEKQLKGEI